jgi:ABC-type lipoprotein release transport system permease subunit
MSLKDKKKKNKGNKLTLKGVFQAIQRFFRQVIFLSKFLVLLFFVFIGYLLDTTSKETVNKPKKTFRISFSFLKPFYNKIYIRILKIFDTKKDNDVKNSDLILLALKNLTAKKSRTYVTVGGMAIGFGAVILLLSLGYGFERLVVSQIASLSEMQQIEVTTSQGSPLSFNYDVINQISENDKIDAILPTITTVAKVEYNNAVSDIISYGVTTRYIEESRIDLVEGSLFNSSPNTENPKITHKEDSDVAGISTKVINTESFGNEIYQIKYSIYPLVWKPIYLGPNIDSKIVGYTKRNVGQQEGVEVFGSIYPGINPENRSMDYTGQEYGPWIKDTFPLWEKRDCSVDDYNCVDGDYIVKESDGSQIVEVGYITETEVSVDRYMIKEGNNLEIYKDKEFEKVDFKFKQGNQTDMFFDSDIGSTRLTVLNQDISPLYKGILTFGSEYESEDNMSIISSSGEVFGYWIKTEIELFGEEGCNDICDVYYTQRQSDKSKLINLSIYIKASDVEIENLNIPLSQANVLGETDSNTESNLIDIEELVDTDEEIDWVEIIDELGVGENVEADIKTLPLDAQRVALVNTSMLNLLGITANRAVGETFDTAFVFDSKLFNRSNYLVESEKGRYEIVGVVSDSRGPSFYVPYEDMLVDGMESVSNLKIIVNDTKDIQPVREYIESLGFQTNSVVDTVDQIGSLFSTLRIVLLLLGLIALGVASLGMFNTLTVSLLEKTREVGLLKTMGMKSDEIKVLFIAESIIISVLGGVSGVVLGFLAGKLFSSMISIIAVSQGQGIMDITHIPGLLIIGTVTLASVVGVVTGWYPAKRATKISALNALRYE